MFNLAGTANLTIEILLPLLPSWFTYHPCQATDLNIPPREPPSGHLAFGESLYAGRQGVDGFNQLPFDLQFSGHIIGGNLFA